MNTVPQKILDLKPGKYLLYYRKLFSTPIEVTEDGKRWGLNADTLERDTELSDEGWMLPNDHIDKLEPIT